MYYLSNQDREMRFDLTKITYCPRTKGCWFVWWCTLLSECLHSWKITWEFWDSCEATSATPWVNSFHYCDSIVSTLFRSKRLTTTLLVDRVIHDITAEVWNKESVKCSIGIPPCDDSIVHSIQIFDIVVLLRSSLIKNIFYLHFL